MVLRAARTARGDGVVALGGGAHGLGAGARGARAATRSCTWRSTPDEAWRRASGKGRPLARDRGRFEQLHADRAAPLRVGGRRRAAARRPRTSPAGALPALLALRDARAAGRTARMVWAQAASGDYPVFVGRGLLARGVLPPARRPPLRGDRRERGAPPPRRRPSTRSPCPAGEEDKTLATAECVLRAPGAGGRRARRRRGGRGRRRGRRPGGLLRRASTSAACATCRCRPRSWPRSTPPTAARPASTCPRARTTWAPIHQPAAVLCDPAALDTLPAEELAAGYAEVVKTALIAGGPLWARVRAGRRGRRGGDPRLPAHQAGRGGGGRARRRPAPGAEPRAHGRATRSRPRRATSATATARRSASGCWRRCGCRAGTRCATEVAGLLAARGLPLDVRRGRRRRRAGARGARQEAHAAGGCRSCSWRRPARSPPATTWRPATCALRSRRCARDEEPRGRDARGQPRPARPARPAITTARSRCPSWRRR